MSANDGCILPLVWQKEFVSDKIEIIIHNGWNPPETVEFDIEAQLDIIVHRNTLLSLFLHWLPI